jgi:hypothetical protein
MAQKDSDKNKMPRKCVFLNQLRNKPYSKGKEMGKLTPRIRMD